MKGLISLDTDLKIYIHTWNIYSNSLSWRTVRKNNKIVTVDTVNSYFKDISNNICKVIIDDDNLKVDGICEGKYMKVPIIGWKRMWAGIDKIIREIHTINNGIDDIVINTRFDILELHLFNLLPEYIINSVKSTKLLYLNTESKAIQKDISFIFKDKCKRGIDNLYISSLESMYSLINYIYLNLDDLIKKYNRLTNHEHLIDEVVKELQIPVKYIIDK